MVISLLIGCVATPSVSELDAGALLDALAPLDAGALDSAISIDAPVCVAAMTPGCPCTDPGLTHCESDLGVVCCGGAWRAFSGSPCAGAADAGMPTCTGPALGCTCADEGAIQCSGVYQWRLRCTSGVWLADVGHVCC